VHTPADPPESHGFLFNLLRRIIEVQPGEVRALGWSWLFFFSVLFSYYVIRPIRDEMGVAGGVDNLSWLFTGTLVAMMLANPPFAALVARLPRVRFISVAYRFFIANLVVFFLLLLTSEGEQNIWVGRIFFIWAAVFNLFVVSVFWAFMTDVFTRSQGLRLFGFISAGWSSTSVPCISCFFRRRCWKWRSSACGAYPVCRRRCACGGACRNRRR
jgi:AAA family ATP:ADP antiporter